MAVATDAMAAARSKDGALENPPEIPRAQLRTEPPGGCAAHGIAWLVISAVMLIIMLLITTGCYFLYRLIG